MVRNQAPLLFISSWRDPIFFHVSTHQLGAKFLNGSLLLGSVRYAYDVIGIAAAIAYYFPNHPSDHPLNRAQIFFLLERLSNVTGTFPQSRIQSLVTQAVSTKILLVEDVSLLSALYLEVGEAKHIDLQGQIPALQA